MPNLRLFSIAALAAVVAAPVAGAAQTPPPPPPANGAMPSPEHHHRRHESFLRALRSVDLTPAQKQQVAAFRAQQRQANENADPATKQANAAKMRDQVMGILTPDQKAQLSAAMHHRNGGDAPGSMPMPAPSPQ